MAKRIAGAIVEEQDGKRRLHLWIPLPKRQRDSQYMVLVILAVVIAGLVILLALQVEPALAQLLMRLLGIV